MEWPGRGWLGSFLGCCTCTTMNTVKVCPSGLYLCETECGGTRAPSHPLVQSLERTILKKEANATSGDESILLKDVKNVVQGW